MKIVHQNLANGSWQKLSLYEQMGNIGSEVGRVARARDEISRQKAFERALELFDLTAGDPKRAHQLKEILRARELFVQEALERNDLSDFDKYFMNFAIAARSR
jgi:hypothetical protein